MPSSPAQNHGLPEISPPRRFRPIKASICFHPSIYKSPVTPSSDSPTRPTPIVPPGCQIARRSSPSRRRLQSILVDSVVPCSSFFFHPPYRTHAHLGDLLLPRFVQRSGRSTKLTGAPPQQHLRPAKRGRGRRPRTLHQVRDDTLQQTVQKPPPVPLCIVFPATSSATIRPSPTNY